MQVSLHEDYIEYACMHALLQQQYTYTFNCMWLNYQITTNNLTTS